MRVSRFWQHNQPRILSVVSVFLALGAVLRLGYEYWRLLLKPEVPVDLGIFHPWVHTWFAGGNIFHEDLTPVVFPAASYVLLWPIFGWLAVTPCRWFFAVTVTLCLVWLIRIMLRSLPVPAKIPSYTVVLYIVAIYATGIAIGNGQLILYILPALLAALLLLFQHKQSWQRDVCASLLLLFSLVKPPVSAPFLLIVLLVNRAYRVVLAVILGYLSLTVLALSFQDVGLDYFKVIADNAARLSTVGGYGNIHFGLYRMGLQAWRFPASIALVGVLAIWLYGCRRRDMWLLLGVTAIVARVWTYHRLYDDLLMIVPMIALYRICCNPILSVVARRISGLLLLLIGMALLGPGTLLRAATPVGDVYRTVQVVLWLSAMLLFVCLAWSDRSASSRV